MTKHLQSQVLQEWEVSPSHGPLKDLDIGLRIFSESSVARHARKTQQGSKEGRKLKSQITFLKSGNVSTDSLWAAWLRPTL